MLILIRSAYVMHRFIYIYSQPVGIITTDAVALRMLNTDYT